MRMPILDVTVLLSEGVRISPKERTRGASADVRCLDVPFDISVI